MKRHIPLILALCSLLSAAVLAQTPTPPPRTAATPPAASTGGGTGAEGKIAIIVAGAFEEGILELKAKIDLLKAEFEPREKALQALNEQLEKIKNQLRTQGTTLSAATVAQLNEQGAELEKRIKRDQEDAQALFQKKQAEHLGPVQEKIGTFLDQYATQRGISMVVEAQAAQQNGLLLYVTKAANITEDFIKEYNKANPVAAPTAAPVKK